MALSFSLGTVPFSFNQTREKGKRKKKLKTIYDQIISLIEINGAEKEEQVNIS